MAITALALLCTHASNKMSKNIVSFTKAKNENNSSQATTLQE